MPSSRPRVRFNAEGICNACEHARDKWENIDWAKRKEEFLRTIEPYRTKDGYWDCIVPWSGGKDSSAIAYHLKFDFGLNPLLVTFSPQVPNEVGDHNREEMVRLGFDHIFFRPNQKVHRKLAKRFFIERGHQKVAWDAGVNTIPIQVAVKYNIPLVFYAEHGESEYGGNVLSEEHKKMRDFTEVVENQVGDDPRNWIDGEDIFEKDIQPYIYPDQSDIARVGVKALYYSYFFKWSSRLNYEFLKEKIDFRLAEGGRTEGTFTNFDSLDDKSDNLYYYMQYIKFGFGRALRDAARQVQNRQMTKEEALDVILKYDHEFPSRYFKDMLEYLDLDEVSFYKIVDQHRNEEIWKKENGQWVLRYPVSAALAHQ